MKHGNVLSVPANPLPITIKASDLELKLNTSNLGAVALYSVI